MRVMESDVELEVTKGGIWFCNSFCVRICCAA